jgi:hypothetical protein
MARGYYLPALTAAMVIAVPDKYRSTVLGIMIATGFKIHYSRKSKAEAMQRTI